MPAGTIKKLVTEKGFGFISSTENGKKDIFFHHSGVTDGVFDNLKEGDSVTFDTDDSQTGGKGPRAVNVKKV